MFLLNLQARNHPWGFPTNDPMCVLLVLKFVDVDEGKSEVRGTISTRRQKHLGWNYWFSCDPLVFPGPDLHQIDMAMATPNL